MYLFPLHANSCDLTLTTWSLFQMSEIQRSCALDTKKLG
uniref:Uncharacterized protein n=1 Tax=Arundo donax TaxID=35708 RepID=A0A0A9ACY6_ARUDO